MTFLTSTPLFSPSFSRGKKLCCALLLTVLVIATLLGQDANDYKFSTSIRPFSLLTGGTTLPNLPNQTVLGSAVNIGFNFYFSNQAYSKLKIAKDGYVTFSEEATISSNINSNGFQVLDAPMLAPLWDNLSGSNGVASYATLGNSPNRIFVVEWKNWGWARLDNRYFTVQALLYEGSNKIELHYSGSQISSVQSATIGISSRDAFSSLKSLNVYHTAWGEWLTTEYNNVNNVSFYPNEGQVFTFTPPTCTPPKNLKIEGITDNRATVRWNKPLAGIPTNYTWALKSYPGDIVPLSSGTTADSVVLLNNLTPLSNYWVSVYATCQNLDLSLVTSRNFYTEREPDVRVPYFEGFELDSSRLPDYWSSNDWKVGSANYEPAVAGEGRNIAYYSGNNARAILTTPSIASIGQTPRLSYKYWIGDRPDNRRDVGVQPLEIYISNANSSELSKIWAHDYHNSIFSSSRDSGWQTQTIDLVGYESSLFKIHFRASIMDWNGQLSTIAVDSVRLNNAPNCVAPINLTAQVFSGDSILIGWEAKDGQNKWEIQYGAKGFRLGQGNRIVANSHPFMVRNLQLNTEYEFYVRSLCSASETSQWSPVSVSAKTLCGGIITDFPYFEGFDSLTLNPCWRIETTKNTFGWQVSYDSLLNNNILPADGRGYMGMKDQNANGLIASLYSPAISLGSEPKRLVYKYFTTPPYSPFAVEISLNQTKWDTLFEHTERNTFNAGGGSFDSWYYRVIDLSNYKNKTIFIRFKFRKTYVNLQPDNHTFLDNFTIENSNNTCQTPTDLSSTGLKDDNSIELAWSKGTNETKWEIEYGDKLFKLGTGIRVQISERPRYILRGEQLSDKEFYVRGVCGTNAFTRWVGPLRCLNPRPALYAISLYPDASPQMEGNKIDWKFLSFIRTSPISANNQQGVPASHLNNQWRTETELAFTNLGQLSWIVSPRIHNLRQGTHRLNFRINIYSDRSFPIQLTVGTMSSRKDTNSFIPSVQYPISDTIMTANNARGTFIRKTIDFTNTPEGNDFIAFRYYCPNDDSNAGQNRVAFAVDSIELERVPTCSTPINVKIDAAKITYKGATVKWQRGTIPNNTASGFNWRVTEKDKSPFVKNPVIAGTTSADSVRFEGLEPRTVYDFYVQSFCSDPNDTCTYWTKATRFRTAAVNDDCSNATTLTVFEDALSVTRNDYKYFINGNHQSDIRTTDITCPTSNQPIQDIWYVINTPNSSSRVVLKTFSDLLSGTTIDWVMAVYKGSCDNLTYVGCSDNYLTPPNNFDYTMPTYFLTNYEPNAKYYIRLYNKVNYDFQREYLLPIDSAKIIVYCEQSACPNPPINDKCANAINLVSGYTEGVNNKYATRDANSNSDVVCEPNVNIKDIWYKFHTDTGSFRTFRMALNIRNNGTGSLKYAIYKGSCNNLYRMSDCKSIVINTQKTDTFDLLEANQDYFICVWSHSDSTTAASNSTIRIDKLRNFDAIPLGNATTTNLCQPFKSVEINLSNSNKWVSLVDNTGIVGEINANGNLLGQVTGSYYINSTGTIRRATSVPYLDRNIGIKVTNQPTRDVSIRLYFTEAELAAYYDVVGTNPVAITHYAGALCSPTALSIVGDVLPATIGRTANRNNYVQFNTQRFSGFLVGPYTALVPVELKSFSASAQEKGNLLQWVTASEKGNAHFILERSGSGLDFESIATIKGKGSSVTQSNYQFEDTNPLPVSYYRLKQIDVNGNSAYSKTISVIHEKNTLQPRFYPSIAKDFITIELFNNSQTEVSITNLTGKMVLNQPNITNTSQLNISHLTAGFYIVSIRQAGVHISGRLVKN